MNNEQIKEINQHISSALKQWSEIMLIADVDEWAHSLEYSRDDLMNAMCILNHVAGNIGIKSGHINEENVEAFGLGFRKLMIEITGLDPWDLANENTHDNDR